MHRPYNVIKAEVKISRMAQRTAGHCYTLGRRGANGHPTIVYGTIKAVLIAIWSLVRVRGAFLARLAVIVRCEAAVTLTLSLVKTAGIARSLTDGTRRAGMVARVLLVRARGAVIARCTTHARCAVSIDLDLAERKGFSIINGEKDIPSRNRRCACDL